jgi:hypothetical protein
MLIIEIRKSKSFPSVKCEEAWSSNYLGRWFNPSRCHFSGTKKSPLLTKSQEQYQRDLLTKFLNAKRPNLSPCTFTLYEYCLTLFATHYEISSEGINAFLADVSCGNAKGNYHQIITTFARWLLKMG